jgi:hypothetical protein
VAWSLGVEVTERAMWVQLALLGFLALGATLYSCEQQIMGHYLLGGVFAVLLVMPAVLGERGGGGPRRVMAWRPLAWLCLISCGIYLWYLAARLLHLQPLIPRSGRSPCSGRPLWWRTVPRATTWSSGRCCGSSSLTGASVSRVMPPWSTTDGGREMSDMRDEVGDPDVAQITRCYDTR